MAQCPRPPSAVFDHGHAFSEGVRSEHKCSSVPPSSNAARLRRACGLLPAERRTPHLVCDRAGAGPMTTFSSFCSVGTITRSVPPRSSRRNAVIGPTAARSLRLRFAPAPRGLVQSFNVRGRRGGFAAPAAVSPGLCCGPRYEAIWRAQARTSWPRLAALATRPSSTAARRL